MSEQSSSSTTTLTADRGELEVPEVTCSAPHANPIHVPKAHNTVEVDAYARHSGSDADTTAQRPNDCSRLECTSIHTDQTDSEEGQ